MMLVMVERFNQKPCCDLCSSFCTFEYILSNISFSNTFDVAFTRLIDLKLETTCLLFSLWIGTISLTFEVDRNCCLFAIVLKSNINDFEMELQSCLKSRFPILSGPYDWFMLRFFKMSSISMILK